jgi:hypothetical protein
MLTKTELKLKKALDKHTELCNAMLHRRLTEQEEKLLVKLELKIDFYSEHLEKNLVPLTTYCLQIL